MSAIEILTKFNLASDRLTYVARGINNQYEAVDIFDKNGTVRFREYYYIVDNTNGIVYLADDKAPDLVHIAKIERGTVQAHASEAISV